MVARILLAISSVIALVGSAVHAVAFGRAATAIAASGLESFYGNSFKELWLGDSSMLCIVGLAFGHLAWRPRAATRSAVIFLAAIPALQGMFVYRFVGFLVAVPLLFAISGLALASAAFPAGPTGIPFDERAHAAPLDADLG